MPNDRLIAHHRNQQDVEPLPKSTLTFAYGNFRYQKMTEELSGTDDLLRTKTLIEVIEDLKHTSSVVDAVRSDLCPELRRALTDSNDTIRELASRSFASIARVREGKVYLAEHGIITDIARLFDDAQEHIRRNAYDALLFLSEMREGCEAVVAAGIIEVLVDKTISEKTERVMIQTLTLIQQLLQLHQGSLRALKTPVVVRMKRLLESVSSELKRLAAENLATLSFLPAGKKKVIEEGCVAPLSAQLFDDIVEVRGAALLALASLSIENDAKVQLIEGQVLDRIMALLSDKSAQNRLNAIQLVSNVAEHPVAKVEFQSALNRLRDLIDSENEIIAQYAGKAIDAITWRP